MGAEPWGKIIPLNSPVSGSEDGRELFPCQENMGVIQSRPRQEQWEQPNLVECFPALEARQWGQPKTSGRRRKGKDPTVTVPQAAPLLLRAQRHFLTLANTNTHAQSKSRIYQIKKIALSCLYNMYSALVVLLAVWAPQASPSISFVL